MTVLDLMIWTRCDDALSVAVLGDDPLQLQLVGDLDVVNAEDALSVVASYATVGHRVVLDLQRLTFIDTSGVRALQRLADFLACGELVIMNPSAIAHRLLELTGIATRRNVRLYAPEPLTDLSQVHPAGRD